MNQIILFTVGLLLAIPSIVSANKAYTITIQCETAIETKCTVKSKSKIRSVRAELYFGKNNRLANSVSKKFKNCPTEVSVSLASVVPVPGAKFFVETCDGSNSIETIVLR